MEPTDALPSKGIILSPEEVAAVTGYKRPGDQLAELRAQGFFRARLSPTTGGVILERVHYVAVCQGTAIPTNTRKIREPRVLP